MRTLFLFSLLTVVFSLGLSQISYALCTFGGNTGSGGNIINCPEPLQSIPLNGASTPPNDTTGNGDEVNIPLNGGVSISDTTPAIDTIGGADVVNVAGTIMNDMDDGLETGGGGDTLTVNTGANISGIIGLQTQGGADTLEFNGGTVTGIATRAVGTGGGADFVVVNGGTFNGPESIRTAAGADTLRIFGGTFNGPIATAGNPDNVFIEGGTFNGNGIGLGGGDDFINIAGNISDLGTISCGGGAANTLRFSILVPEADLPALTAELAGVGPTDDIEINGNTYAWTGCEIIENNLNGVVANLTLGPIFAENPVSTSHTVTAVLTTNVGQNEGVEVFFEVTSGPNTDLNSEISGRCSNPSCTTDANGEVSWIYVSNGMAGVDEIVSSFDDQFIGASTSNTVEKEWVFPPKDVPTLSEWGLIAMASVLGIVGFMVIRRRQAAA